MILLQLSNNTTAAAAAAASDYTHLITRALSPGKFVSTIGGKKYSFSCWPGFLTKVVKELLSGPEGWGEKNMSWSSQN